MTTNHERSSGMPEGHAHQETGGDGHPFPNSHLLVHAFDYVRPSSIEEASALLGSDPEAALLAGGTNLLVDMKLERSAPSRVIDITHLPGLSGIEVQGEDLVLGALTRIRDLALSEPVWTRASCLADAAAAFGSTQIMMMGTLGGNIANGSPASDTVPSLIVLGAEAELAGPNGTRSVLVADLLDAPGRIAAERGEMLTRVRIPAAPAGTGSAFLKLSRVRADLAKVSVAVRIVRDGERMMNVRIALGSVGPTVLRAKRASDHLSGRKWHPDALLEAARMAASEIQPIDDVRSTADYRRKAAIALVYDALQMAWARASEGVSALPRGRVADPAELGPSAALGPIHVARDARTTITLVVNGRRETLDVAPNELLLNVLRERFELTGAKYGCGIGECGACTVWLNGQPVLGCLVLAIAADGGSVRTIEGEAADGELSLLQQAFIDENAFQCGYCTPGMIMMSKKLLEEIPQPTEDEVRDFLKGNHCRCTGYASIVRAIDRAARRGET